MVANIKEKREREKSVECKADQGVKREAVVLGRGASVRR